jgi:homoserine O-acetyltransferase
MTDTFSSSDSVRSGATLRHARKITLAGPWKLELGGVLPSVQVCYETYGTLSARRDNAVFICHALSGDSHVARHSEADDAGWWDLAVGPGKAIDTDRFFIICANVLGGCRGTTGPSDINPATGHPWGGEFPEITTADMVNVQAALVDELGIDRLLAVVGGSMGGMQAIQWALAHPHRVAAAVPIATTCRLSAQALAFDVVGRNAIRKDPGFCGGQYYGGPGPADGLAIARMIGHVTYLSRQSMADKFDGDRHQPREVEYEYEKEFSVGSYLAYQGGRFVERFDANSYIALSLAMDRFDVARDFGPLETAFAHARCRWLVVSFTSDWLFPTSQSRQIVDAIIAAERPVTYCNMPSDCGHDAFLLAEDLARYGPLVSAFLARTLNGDNGRAPAPPQPLARPDRRSIYHHGPRLDYDQIENLIPAGVGVLDLGCGDGQLLGRLKKRGHKDLLGLELDGEALAATVVRGVDVLQYDLDQGLAIQTVNDPPKVLLELVRVGEIGIVSFPNFAHKSVREYFWAHGKAPVTAAFPYSWYDSPNRHFLSIVDFQDLCQKLGIRIHRMVALDSATACQVTEDANLNADMAIFVISRP